jgi:hypothetical protein
VTLAVFVVGALLLLSGVWLFSPPAALVVAGLLLMVSQVRL